MIGDGEGEGEGAVGVLTHTLFTTHRLSDMLYTCHGLDDGYTVYDQIRSRSSLRST